MILSLSLKYLPMVMFPKALLKERSKDIPFWYILYNRNFIRLDEFISFSVIYLRFFKIF